MVLILQKLAHIKYTTPAAIPLEINSLQISIFWAPDRRITRGIAGDRSIYGDDELNPIISEHLQLQEVSVCWVPWEFSGNYLKIAQRCRRTPSTQRSNGAGKVLLWTRKLYTGLSIPHNITALRPCWTHRSYEIRMIHTTLSAARFNGKCKESVATSLDSSSFYKSWTWKKCE